MKKKIKSKKALILGVVAFILIALLIGLLFSNDKPEMQSNQQLEESIHIFTPEPDEVISFPLEITGEAKSEWFEDGQFPIRVLSEVGTSIANGIVVITEPISEDGYTSFTASLDEFDTSNWEFGTLMFIKSDPLQFSSNEQVVFPINFPKKD